MFVSVNVTHSGFQGLIKLINRKTAGLMKMQRLVFVPVLTLLGSLHKSAHTQNLKSALR